VALTFNGSVSNYASKAISFSANKGTLMGWVKMTSDPNTYQCIFEMNAVDNNQMGLYTQADGTTISTYLGASDSTVTGSSLTIGTWYHLAVTWDGSSLRAYVDATLNITHTNTGTTWNMVQLGFDEPYWGDTFVGAMAHLKAWDAVLTQTEIATEKGSITAVRTSNLLGQWETPSGASRADDTSGNANHFTVTGTLTDTANPLASISVTDTASGSDALTIDTGGSSSSLSTNEAAVGLDAVVVGKGPYYVNSATASSGPGVTGLTVNVPSGTADGDLMLAIIVIELSSGTATPPAGWTQLWNATNASRSHTQIVYARTASSEPANYSWSWTSAECAAAIITYRNAAYPSQYGGQFNNSSIATAAAPSLTTASPNSMSVYFGSIAYGTTWSPPTSPGTYTERVDIRSSTASTNLALTIAEYAVSVSGTACSPVGTAANADYNAAGQVIIPPLAVSVVLTETGRGAEGVSYSAGSGDQSITVTDTSSGSDAISSLSVSLALTDTGAGAESFGGPSASVPVGETGSSIDALSRLIASLLVGESGASTDLLSSLTAALLLGDSGTSVDAISSIVVALALSDTAAATDLLSVLILKAIADTASGTDLISSITTSLAIADAATAVDLLFAVLYQTVTETGSGTDIVASIASSLAVVDSGAATDLISILISKLIAESANGSDLVASIVSALVVTDSGLGLEAASIAALALIADSGAAIDALAVLYLVFLTESGQAQDFIAAVVAALTLQDSGGAMDAIASIGASVPVTDSGTGADSQSISVILTIGDAGTSTDSLLRLVLVALSEAATGVDSLSSVAVTFSLSDNGTSSDAVSLQASVVVADAGSVVDALFALTEAIKQITETGLGSDTVVSPLVSLTVVEAASGSDQSTISVTLSIGETGQGSDLLSLAVVTMITIVEAVTGVDQIVVNVSPIGVPEIVVVTDQAGIDVSLAITDSGSSSDSLLPQILVAIVESASGFDSPPSVAVNALVGDLGEALDLVGGLAVALSVLETGSAVDFVLSYDSATRIVKVDFSFKHRSVEEEFSMRTVDLAEAARQIDSSIAGREVTSEFASRTSEISGV